MDSEHEQHLRRWRVAHFGRRPTCGPARRGRQCLPRDRAIVPFCTRCLSGKVCHPPGFRSTLLVITNIGEIMQSTLEELINTIKHGNADRNTVGHLKCPVCGKQLTLSFHPNGTRFAIECTNLENETGKFPIHYYMTDEVIALPTWWQEFTRPLWTD